MINGYYVHYYMGIKKANVFKLWIAAQNEEEAVHNCTIQARHRHGGNSKVHIIGVESDTPKLIPQVSTKVVENSNFRIVILVLFLVLISIPLVICRFILSLIGGF